MAVNDYNYNEVCKFLEEYYNKKCEKFQITSVSSAGDSFVSDIYKIEVKNDGNKVFIMKIIRPSRVSKEVPYISNSFIREISAYEELFKEYRKLEDEFGVKDSDKFNSVRVLKSSTIRGKEYIIMENLYESGFKMHDRYKSLNREHIVSIINQFAKFHALSFALRHYKSDVFDRIAPKVIAETIIDVKAYIEMSNQRGIEVLEKEEDKERLRVYLKEVTEIRERLLGDKNATKNPHYVLVHSDGWINNFMFKYGANADLEQTMVLDWQVMGCSSPMHDVLHVIFLSTDGEFRQKHYDEVVQHYYMELGKCLSRLNLSIEEVYPRDVFEHDKILFLSHGLGVSLGALPFVLAKNDGKLCLDDVYGDDINDSSVIYSDLIVKRLRESILDILNIIDKK